MKSNWQDAKAWKVKRTVKIGSDRTVKARCIASLGYGRFALGLGQKIYVCSQEATVEQVLKGHTGVVNALANLGEGRLASASADGTVRIWADKGHK